MHQGDLLNAPVINRDDHDQSLGTCPTPRHQFHRTPEKALQYQSDIQLDGMMHNHPSGDPKPSRDDIEMTREIKAAAGALGISIHDHLVIGRKGHASFRSLGLLT